MSDIYDKLPQIIATLFFSVPLFLWLLGDRYATLASLLRKTREDLEKDPQSIKILNNGKHFSFHIRTYQQRLYLLVTTIVLIMINCLLMISALLLTFGPSTSLPLTLFSISLILLAISFVLYISELLISFRALRTHIHNIHKIAAKVK